MCVLHLEPAVKEERSNAARRRGVYVSNFVLNMVLISDDICSNCSFGLKTEMGITRSAAASQQFAYCRNGGRVKKQRFSGVYAFDIRHLLEIACKSRGTDFNFQIVILKVKEVCFPAIR